MGLFSNIFKSKPVVPSLEEQRRNAEASVDSFLKLLGVQLEMDKKGEVRRECFRIAGISHHAGYGKKGMIKGVTIIDSNNPKDETAVAICALTNNGQQVLLGYIPKDEKKRYFEFTAETENQQAPFIGFLNQSKASDGRVITYGIIKTYLGDGKAFYDRMVKDALVIRGAFKGYYMDQTLKEQEMKLEWVLERQFEWK